MRKFRIAKIPPSYKAKFSSLKIKGIYSTPFMQTAEKQPDNLGETGKNCIGKNI